MIVQDDIPLADAGMQLRVDYRRAYALMMAGDLEGRRRGAHWFVTRDSVERYKRSLIEQQAVHLGASQ